MKILNYSFSLIMCLFSSVSLYGQGVAINPLASSTSPDPSAMLDVNSSEHGVLFPRVELVSTTNPISSPAEGLVVYNTSESFGIGKGFYFFNGAGEWESLSRISTPVSVENGGTGTTTLNAGNILTGNGTNQIESSLSYLNVSPNGDPPNNPDANNTIVQRDAFGRISSTGYRCRTGRSGNNQTHFFNFEYVGANDVRVFIDNTSIGNIVNTSDRRLKSNISNLENHALQRVMQLRPVSYQFKDIEGTIFRGSGELVEGFIADELQMVIPSAVTGESDELTIDGTIQPQTLNLGPVVSVLTKAIQEQQKIIQSLEQKLETKITAHSELKKQINELEEMTLEKVKALELQLNHIQSQLNFESNK